MDRYIKVGKFFKLDEIRRSSLNDDDFLRRLKDMLIGKILLNSCDAYELEYSDNLRVIQTSFLVEDVFSFKDGVVNLKIRKICRNMGLLIFKTNPERFTIYSYMFRNDLYIYDANYIVKFMNNKNREAKVEYYRTFMRSVDLNRYVSNFIKTNKMS